MSTKIIQTISSTIKRTNNQKTIDYNELSKNNLEQLFKKTKQIIINNYQLIKNLVNKNPLSRITKQLAIINDILKEFRNQ